MNRLAPLPVADPPAASAGDVLGAARLPLAVVERPQKNGATQLRGRLRLAARRRAGGRGAALLQRVQPAHGPQLAALLLALDHGRDGGHGNFWAAPPPR